MSDDTRRIILARRARFVAAALASVAATTTAIAASTEGCSGGTDTEQSDSGAPQPCLKIRPDAAQQPDADADKDADADAEPQPCLIAPLDGG